MSTLSQFAAGGVKSIQTGFVQASFSLFGSGEEARYIDVTVSAVTNVAKCFVTFNGSANSGGSLTAAYYNSTITFTVIPTVRVLNSTTIRIMSSNASATNITGRWTLIEYF